MLLYALSSWSQLLAQPVGGSGRAIVPGTHFKFTDSAGGVTPVNAATWLAGNGWQVWDNENGIRTPDFNLESLKAGNLKWYVRTFSPDQPPFPANSPTYVSFQHFYNNVGSGFSTDYSLITGQASMHSGSFEADKDWSLVSLEISKYNDPSGIAPEPDGLRVFITEFWIEADAAVLPVNFGKINATIQDNGVSINWQTLTETNCSHFEIEASADGTNFKEIGKVRTKALNGNSDTTISYNFELAHDLAGLMGGASLVAFLVISASRKRRHSCFVALLLVFSTSFFVACQKTERLSISNAQKLFIRIKQMDKDGTSTYSKVLQVVPR